MQSVAFDFTRIGFHARKAVQREYH